MPLAAADVPFKRRFAGPMDAAGERAYTVGLTLPTGVTISTATATLHPDAIALGVEIVRQTHDTTSMTVTLGVSAGQHESAAFATAVGTLVSWAWAFTLSDVQSDERSYAAPIGQL